MENGRFFEFTLLTEDWVNNLRAKDIQIKILDQIYR